MEIKRLKVMTSIENSKAEIRAQIEKYKMAMASMSGKQQKAYHNAYIKPLQQKLDDISES